MQAPVIHIQLDKDGIPRTINKRVKVNIIAVKYRAGDSVEQIATHYNISLADVHAALAYYYDHESYFEERRQQAQGALEKYGVSGQNLKAKIQARLDNMQDNSV